MLHCLASRGSAPLYFVRSCLGAVTEDILCSWSAALSRDEGIVAVVPVLTAQEGATAVVELPDSSEEYVDSMDIDPAAAASAAAHIAEFASAGAGVLEAGTSEGGPSQGDRSVRGPLGVPPQGARGTGGLE